MNQRFSDTPVLVNSPREFANNGNHLKFNPNHDPDNGQFTDAAGAGTMPARSSDETRTTTDRGRPDEGRGRGGGERGSGGGTGADSGGAGGVKPAELSGDSGRSPQEFSDSLRSGGVRGGAGSAHADAVLKAAKESGAFIPYDDLDTITSKPNVGGSEHEVYLDAASNRYYKLTVPTYPDDGEPLSAAKSSPFGLHKNAGDYLKAMQRQNELAPELGIKVHGVTQGPSGEVQIVTSANRIEGTHPSREELSEHLKSQGWQFKPGAKIGNTWRDPATGAEMADAHRGNWIKTPAGKFVPIDVHYTPPKPKKDFGLEAIVREVLLKFSEDQPRVPAGSPDGGEFGSGGGRAPDEFAGDPHRAAARAFADDVNRRMDSLNGDVESAKANLAKDANAEYARLQNGHDKDELGQAVTRVTQSINDRLDAMPEGLSATEYDAARTEAQNEAIAKLPAHLQEQVRETDPKYAAGDNDDIAEDVKTTLADHDAQAAEDHAVKRLPVSMRHSLLPEGDIHDALIDDVDGKIEAGAFDDQIDDFATDQRAHAVESATTAVPKEMQHYIGLHESRINEAIDEKGKIDADKVFSETDDEIKAIPHRVAANVIDKAEKGYADKIVEHTEAAKSFAIGCKSNYDEAVNAHTEAATQFAEGANNKFAEVKAQADSDTDDIDKEAAEAPKRIVDKANQKFAELDKDTSEENLSDEEYERYAKVASDHALAGEKPEIVEAVGDSLKDALSSERAEIGPDAIEQEIGDWADARKEDIEEGLVSAADKAVDDAKADLSPDARKLVGDKDDEFREHMQENGEIDTTDESLVGPSDDEKADYAKSAVRQAKASLTPAARKMVGGQHELFEESLVSNNGEISAESDDEYIAPDDDAKEEYAKSSVKDAIRDVKGAGRKRLKDDEDTLVDQLVNNEGGKIRSDVFTSEYHDPYAEPENKSVKFNEAHDAQGRFSETDAGGRSAVRSRRAEIGEMHQASRVTDGKNARIVMADGSELPAHIKPGMIPPAYSRNIQISKDPEADVWVRSEDEDGNVKPVYNPKFVRDNQDTKFSRIRELSQSHEAIKDEIQSDRAGSQKNEADAAWLMDEQGTRPGSEEDTKGSAQLWDKPAEAEITQDKKGGVPKVTLRVGGEKIPIRDEAARQQIAARVASGEPLGDAGYWIKSHGATTLEGRHIIPTEGGGAKLQFMGKESVWHDHQIQNPKLAAMLLDRKASAGDRGLVFGTDYNATAKYVGKLGSGNFSPKDLRTTAGTETAARIVGAGREFENDKAATAYKMDVATKVSRLLGNKPEQALKTYIDPSVFDVVKVKSNAAKNLSQQSGAILWRPAETRLAQAFSDPDIAGRSRGYRGWYACGRGVRQGRTGLRSGRGSQSQPARVKDYAPDAEAERRRKEDETLLLLLLTIDLDADGPEAVTLWRGAAPDGYEGLIDSTDDWDFDPITQTYSNAGAPTQSSGPAPSGPALPLAPAALKQATIAVGQTVGAQLAQTAGNYFAGHLDPQTFLAQFGGTVKNLYIAQAAAAAGGVNELTDDDVAAIEGDADEGTGLEFALERLLFFRKAIDDAELQSIEAVAARAALYAATPNALFEGIRREHHNSVAGGVFTHERSVLGPSEHHCHDSDDAPGCVECAEAGWQPIGTIDLPGLRTCAMNCQCWMEYGAPSREFAESEKGLKSNPNHEPAGSPEGGEFASGGGGGASDEFSAPAEPAKADEFEGDPHRVAARAYVDKINARISALGDKPEESGPKVAQAANDEFAKRQAERPEADREANRATDADAAADHAISKVPDGMKPAFDKEFVSDLLAGSDDDKIASDAFDEHIEDHLSDERNGAKDDAYESLSPRMQQYVDLHNEGINEAIEKGGKIDADKVFAETDDGIKAIPAKVGAQVIDKANAAYADGVKRATESVKAVASRIEDEYAKAAAESAPRIAELDKIAADSPTEIAKAINTEYSNLQDSHSAGQPLGDDTAEILAKVKTDYATFKGSRADANALADKYISEAPEESREELKAIRPKISDALLVGPPKSPEAMWADADSRAAIDNAFEGDLAELPEEAGEAIDGKEFDIQRQLVGRGAVPSGLIQGYVEKYTNGLKDSIVDDDTAAALKNAGKGLKGAEKASFEQHSELLSERIREDGKIGASDLDDVIDKDDIAESAVKQATRGVKGAGKGRLKDDADSMKDYLSSDGKLSPDFFTRDYADNAAEEKSIALARDLAARTPGLELKHWGPEANGRMSFKADDRPADYWFTDEDGNRIPGHNAGGGGSESGGGLFGHFKPESEPRETTGSLAWSDDPDKAKANLAEKQRHEDDHKANLSKLSPKETRTVGKYVGSGYSMMNNRLRNDPRLPKTGDVTNLQKVIDAAPPTSVAVNVHRGMQSFPHSLPAVGETIQLNGFTSTAPIAQTHFLSPTGQSFEIHIPKGSKGVLATDMAEQEYILHHGAKLKYLGSRNVKYKNSSGKTIENPTHFFEYAG